MRPATRRSAWASGTWRRCAMPQPRGLSTNGRSAAASTASTASSRARPTSSIPTSPTTTTEWSLRQVPTTATTSQPTWSTAPSPSSTTRRRCDPIGPSSATSLWEPPTRPTRRRRGTWRASGAAGTTAGTSFASSGSPASSSWVSCLRAPIWLHAIPASSRGRSSPTTSVGWRPDYRRPSPPSSSTPMPSSAVSSTTCAIRATLTTRSCS